MPNRILFLVSVMLASLALPAISDVARAADDDCLTSPNKATPAGGHWRYHLERGTGRKCWYLAEAEKSDAAQPDVAQPDVAQSDAAEADPPKPVTKITPSLERAAASPPDRPVAAKPAPAGAPPVAQAPATPLVQWPANNARAEFIDAPRSEPPAPAAALPPQPAPAAAPEAAPQGAVSTRWPSPDGTSASDNGNAPSTPSSAGPAPSPPSQPVAVQAAAGSADPATAAAPTADVADGPDYLLYALIAVTLAFAGVVAWIGVRFLVAQLQDWREERKWRRELRSHDYQRATRGDGLLAMGEIQMGLVPAGDAAQPRAQTHRAHLQQVAPRRVEDEIDEIEQLLALTRQAGTQSQLASWDAQTPRHAAE